MLWECLNATYSSSNEYPDLPIEPEFFIGVFDPRTMSLEHFSVPKSKKVLKKETY
jgi:hypothetical protein